MMFWKNLNWPPIILVVYFLGVLVTFGHYVSRSDACPADGQYCAAYRVMTGAMVVMWTWPLYWSAKAWEP